MPTNLPRAPLALLLLAVSACGARTGLYAPHTTRTGAGGASGTGGASAACGSTAPRSLACGGQLVFPPAPSPTTDLNPTSLVVGDLNGDGKLDYVVATDEGEGAVGVRLGNGDGTFGAQTLYSFNADPSGSPEAVALGDLDGDGVLDLAVATFLSVALMHGNGDGTFSGRTDYPVGTGIDSGGTIDGGNSIALADVNGDGALDIVVANNDDLDDSVSVLLNNGDGSFAAKIDYPTGDFPMSVVVRDLNGDCKPDIVVADFGPSAGSQSSNVSVLLNHGDGTFSPEVRYPVGNNPTAVVVADLDGDGKPDLAVSNSFDGTVSVLIGHGDGTFAARVDYPTGANPSPLVAADLLGDGKIGLITVKADNTVTVLANHGDGTFAPPIDFPTGSTANGLLSFSLVAADLNGDGRLDLVMPDASDNLALVLLGSCAP